LDNDFGFTAIDEIDIDTNLPKIETMSARIEKMYGLIKPLLENLLKNPEKEYIKWPNRDVVIKKMLEELEGIKNVT